MNRRLGLMWGVVAAVVLFTAIPPYAEMKG